MRVVAGTCLTSLFALTACLGGGGASGDGGSASSGLNLPLSSSPAAFETAEYRGSGGLEPIGASTLYAADGTGDGVTVAVIDTGIDSTHPEFAGAIHPASRDLVRDTPLVDGSGHGTAVAGLLAARRNGQGMHGMAYAARLMALRTDVAGSCPDACLFAQDTLAIATDHAVAAGAGVLNFSLGEAAGLGSGLRRALGGATGADRLLVFASGNKGSDQPSQPAMFATSNAARGRALVVGAVGSDDAITTFSNRAGTAAEVFLVAPGESLTTTADGGGAAVISGTSAATPLVAGAAAALISAAPHLSAAETATILLDSARDLGAAGTDPIYGRGMLDLDQALAPMGPLRVPEGGDVAGQASSLSTSQLALGSAFGGAARELGGVMALDRFDRAYGVALATAPAAVAPALPGFLERQRRGVREQLGQGGLNLAVQRGGPVGPTSLIQGSDITGIEAEWRLAPGLALHGSLGETPGAGLGAVGGAVGGDPMSRPGRSGDAGQALGFGDLAAEAGIGISGALSDEWRVVLDFADEAGNAVAGERGTLAPSRAAGGAPTGRLVRAALVHGRAGDAVAATGDDLDDGYWRLGLGLLEEGRGPLGSRATGALRAGRATTRFVDLAASQPLGRGVRAFGRAELGVTESAGRDGLVAELGPLWSSAFALGLAASDVAGGADTLSLTLLQPLRIESGGARLDVPVGRDRDGGVTRERRRLELEPSGRELDLELAYGRDLGPGRLQSAAMLRFAPGHDADEATELLLGLTYDLRF